jgi:hypothetical protein
MPAVKSALLVEAGSYEPIYWLITDPATGLPTDLTMSGFAAALTVNSSRDGGGTDLLVLTDTSFRRTNTGRVYFQPSSTVSSGWTFRRGYYQVELTHPSGETVRISEGQFVVSAELVD